jgi:hypothetical protein
VLLRREADGGVLAIGQASHAWISGQLARAWGGGAFAVPEPREAVWLAAEQHDTGMAEWDREPTFNPETGLPHSFMEMPLPLHLALWSAAHRRVETQSAHAALLVSLHGTRLYERRDLARLPAEHAAAVTRFLAEQRAVQDRLAERLGADREAVLVQRDLMWTWDWLSLAVCLDWAPAQLGDVPASGGPRTLALAPAGERAVTVDPWPFAVPELEVVADARPLPARLGSAADLQAALGAAPVVPVRFRLAAL